MPGPDAPTVLLLLPESLRARVADAAADEATTPEAWVARAVARQLDERAWQDVLAYGGERARALGLREHDVERLVSESRRERGHAAPHADPTATR